MVTVFSRAKVLQKIKAASRPLYYRIRRIVQMVQDGEASGKPPNGTDFIREFGVCRRAGARFSSNNGAGVNKKKAGRVLEGRDWDEMPFNREECQRQMTLAGLVA